MREKNEPLTGVKSLAGSRFITWCLSFLIFKMELIPPPWPGQGKHWYKCGVMDRSGPSTWPELLLPDSCYTGDLG